MKPAAAPVRPVIVKKVIMAASDGHHGGAWKVAYADFVTAMMAFFLLMWLLGATTEKQRKALADYFAPTLVASKQDSAGSDKLFGGDSIIAADKYPHKAAQTGSRSMTIPRDAKGGPKEASGRAADLARFDAMRRSVATQLAKSADLHRLATMVRFTETRDGLRIDLVDNADFAMFATGTDALMPEAAALLSEVGRSVRVLPNGITVRGHTDSSGWSQGQGMNNWRLSAARAEATRQALAREGVAPFRFVRIEGVADREPYQPRDRGKANNRRISVTLTWSDARDDGSGA